MDGKLAATCAAVAALLAASIGAAFAARSASAAADRAPRPIVTVTWNGGFWCGGCRPLVVRISDTRISGRKVVPRRLEPGERLALLRAIRTLDLAYLRAHPFKGTCPVALDGIEKTYRFRGFPHPLATCTYDLRGVKAVRLVERLMATLRWR